MEQEMRKSTRIKKDYDLQHAPLGNLYKIEKKLSIARLYDISSGGISFETDQECIPGEHCLLKIRFKGWGKKEGHIIQSDNEKEFFSMKAIAEVLRVIKIPETGMYKVSGKFMGRID